jgi:hypothetical protein
VLASFGHWRIGMAVPFTGRFQRASLDARAEPWKRGQEVIAGKDAVGGWTKEG